MYSLRILSNFLLFIVPVISVSIIPTPTLDIEDVTSYSITVNWTVPKNELYSGFVIEIFPEEGDVADYKPMDMKRIFTNLTPGKLYTFVAKAVREEEFSDSVVILQDTVPLPPTNLKLRYFDTLVLTMESPYFGNTEFTIQTAGVEATWSDPLSGVCDCYFATIEPDDGYQAIPGEKEEVLRGERMRQFIHLVPGSTYTVIVHSSTCGEGHGGRLRSEGISATIELPPSDPPTVDVIDVTTTTAVLTWDDAPVTGFYEDFEIVQVGEIKSNIVVEKPDDSTTPSRNLTDLLPCSNYEIAVYSVHEGRRSKNSQSATINTRPRQPLNIKIEDFTETSIRVSWRKVVGNIAGYTVTVRPDSGRVIQTEDTFFQIDNLQPGVKYNITVSSICQNAVETLSFPTTITQTSKPSPPQFSSEKCIYASPSSEPKREISPYSHVPWESPSPSNISITWSKPRTGSWDSFIVHYSPYDYEYGLSFPPSPIVLDAVTTSTQIQIPVSGRVITASIRTVSGNVTSEPMVKKITCGDAEGYAILHCRNLLLYWAVRITPIENYTKLMIEFPDFPIHNATVHLDHNPPQISVHHTNNITVNNPCASAPNSRITIHPICPDVLPFCPVIVRRLCEKRRGLDDTLEMVLPNACCRSKLYNTNTETCCHNKLLKLHERGSKECCGSRWYDRRSQKCCGMNSPGKSYIRNGKC